MILIFDGNNLIYRAFFAVPPLSTSSGIATNAFYGVLKSFRSTIQDFKPDYVVMCWDSGQKTFRHEHDDTYKANRPPIQDNLKVQFPLVQQAFTYLGVPQITAQNVECDDLIGTLAKKSSKSKIKSIIISSDKDFYQLCDEYISVYSSTVKKKNNSGFVDINYIRENFGVEPHQLVDIKSLTGEKTDNIQGVKGIGPKIATKLIQQHGDIFKTINILKNNAVISDRNKLILESLDVIANAYHLAKIKTDIPLPEVSIPPVEQIRIDEQGLLYLFQTYEMNQFIREIGAWEKLFQYKISLV